MPADSAFSCNACIFMIELVSKEVPRGVFLSGNAGTVQLISLYLCTFPLAVRLMQARRRFLIFYVVSTNKENDQRVETAGQTQLTGRFVTIMELK